MIGRMLEATLVLLVMAAAAQGASGPEAAGPALVPWPREVRLLQGRMAITAVSRICVDDASLKPLAEVLSGEIAALGGPKLAIAQGKAKAGDIRLGLRSKLAEGGYALSVGKTAAVAGHDYAAVAAGTATLLQVLDMSSGSLSIAAMEVSDRPFASYRGLLIDVARRTHRIQTLRQMVELCRFYKIRYLQLHLCDDQAFTFPSKAYPQLQTRDRCFSESDLRDLEAYASARGVVIVPEMDVPGHSSALTRGVPELSCSRSECGTLCAGRETTIRMLDTLVGEMCDIFKSTPYFHVGADEVNKDAWASCKDCQAYIKAHNLGSTEELYRDFLVRMNEAVKKHGKRTIAWEGFARGGKTVIPRDVIVMVFESLYNRPDDLVADGYTVINSAWKPLYVVNDRFCTPDYIYGWNMFRWENWWNASKAYPNGIDVKPGSSVLGAQMCAWEQPDEVELPSLRQRLAAMSERVWNPEAGKTYADFSARLGHTDGVLGKLVSAAGK